jgi:hypothetical protein
VDLNLLIRIQPLTEGFPQMVERGEADALIVPAEFDRRLRRFPHRQLL